MQKRKIIGVCGLIGSGKGTVADMLVETHGFQKISFAGKVKDAVAAIFDLDREMLEGETSESRAARDVPDAFWSKELDQEMTPRLMLQLVGTECMRDGFYDGVWTSIVKRKLMENPTTNFVIPDTRFANEISMIRDLGGEIWQVRRGELPEWWETAIMTNTISAEDEWIAYDQGELMENAYPDIHSSEYRWVNTDDNFDQIINNDGTFNDLLNEVKTRLTL